MKKKVVLAYSGGLDTSVICHWLASKGHDVVCVTVDVGQPGLDAAALEKKALASGASKFRFVDAKGDFVKGVFQCVKAEAKYEHRYLLGTSIARPFITEKLVEVAQEEGTHLLAHGATGKGNDQCRFELSAYALMPEAEIIAPWRNQEFRALISGRKEAIAYAEQHGIPVKATYAQPWSTDENLAHVSTEAGKLEDPGFPAPDAVCSLIAPLSQTTDQPETLSIGFEDGFPVSVNGQSLPPVELLTLLNAVGGKHGVGWLDMVENRFVGIKSRGVYQAPGQTLLYAAHRDLEGLTMDRDVMHLRDQLSVRYAELVYNGYWFGPELQALNAFVDQSQQGVSGEVQLQLFKGHAQPISRKSVHSLYDESVSTMEGGGSFDQDDSTGFLKIKGLPFKVQARLSRKRAQAVARA